MAAVAGAVPPGWQVASRQIVEDADLMLVRMSHRGGCGCDPFDGDGADIVATDGNDHVLARQRVDWTDFPLARLTLYVEGLGSERVVLLPSEH